MRNQGHFGAFERMLAGPEVPDKDDTNLPPFPSHPDCHTYTWRKDEIDAIRAYAEAAVLVEREAICTLIDMMFAYTGGHGGPRQPHSDEVCAAIRARSTS